MESGTAVETVEAIDASVSALAAFVRRATGYAVPGTDGVALTGDPDSAGVDPLRDQADAHLDGLAELAKVEAQLAALKVQLVAGYAKAEKALASPAESPQDRTVREMAVTSEIACVLTISERAASALLCDALELTTVRPLTLSALQAGALSWQHARIMVDETANLDPAGAAALEAHFLDPDAPEAARGIPAGELVPCRFRAKVRTWRERHHPVSIEKRHARSTADRRVEYAPDRDGMAWFSAYRPRTRRLGSGTAPPARRGPCRDRTRPGPSPSSAPTSPQPGSSPQASNSYHPPSGTQPVKALRTAASPAGIRPVCFLPVVCPRPWPRFWSPFRRFPCSA